MKRLRSLMLAMPLLFCMTMVSIGFSSWIIVAPSGMNMTATGELHSYGVAHSTDLIYLYGDVEIFDYRAESFVDANGNLTDSGKISVTYRINLANCKSSFGNDWNGSLDLHLSLLAKNVRDVNDGKLFNTSMNNTIAHDTYKYSYAITATVDGASKTITNIEGKILNIDTTLTGLASTGTKDIKVVYTFSIPKNLTGSDIPANFRHCLGRYLREASEDKAGTEFVSTAWVEKAN